MEDATNGATTRTDESKLEALQGCTVCCSQFPPDAPDLIYACPQCEQPYCTDCLRDMFTTTDPHRMPPRCCQFLQLYTAIDILTDDEASTYRKKLEEYLTRDKIYCPRPDCSTFISPMQRSQAVAGSTARDDVIECPECCTRICAVCKQIAHSGSCDTTIADEEKAMLRMFGCKQCPSCHRAIKRMFGCDHMRCLCGADFCWSCLRSLAHCGGCGNYESEGEDEEEDELQVEDEKPIGVAGVVQDEDITPNVHVQDLEIALKASSSNGRSRPDSGYGVTISSAGDPGPFASTPALLGENHPATSVSPATPTVGDESMEVTRSSTAPLPASRPTKFVNHDAGGDIRWGADSDVDFGEDPGESRGIHVWQCTRHRFTQFRSPSNEKHNSGNLDRMECNRCFGKIVPMMENLAEVDPTAEGSTMIPAGEEKTREGGNMQAWKCEAVCGLILCQSCKAIAEEL